MREIKFRAWAINSKKIVDLKKITPLACDPGLLKYGDGLFIPFREDIILMQYTGLKDKNGIEIYEGDIVEVLNSADDENGEFDVTTVCKWDNGCFVLEDCSGGHWTRQLFHAPERLTIKGNIYENASMLTV
jgi:uncharacterized phage protein (TIGR01671 family)